MVSVGVGAMVWAYTRSLYAIVAALLVGVFIDVDHVLDLYYWLVRNDKRRVWVLLHSYELVPPFLAGAYLTGWSPAVLAAALAFLAHILTDQLTNHVRPLTYFLTYRVAHGFRRSELLPKGDEQLYSKVLKIPWATRLLEWLRGKLRV